MNQPNRIWLIGKSGSENGREEIIFNDVVCVAGRLRIVL